MKRKFTLILLAALIALVMAVPALAAPPLGSGFALTRQELDALAAGTAPAWLSGLFALGPA